MTTKELINKLKTFPPDMKVFIYNENMEDCFEVESVGESPLRNPVLYMEKQN